MDPTLHNLFLRKKSHIIPELHDRQPRVLFQLDGALSHLGLRVRKAVDDKFPNRWTGRDGPTLWPAQSPDITPLDLISLGLC